MPSCLFSEQLVPQYNDASRIGCFRRSFRKREKKVSNVDSMGPAEITGHIQSLSCAHMCVVGVGVGLQARRWKDRINKLYTLHNYVGNQCPAICVWVGRYWKNKTDFTKRKEQGTRSDFVTRICRWWQQRIMSSVLQCTCLVNPRSNGPLPFLNALSLPGITEKNDQVIQLKVVQLSESHLQGLLSLPFAPLLSNRHPAGSITVLPQFPSAPPPH